MLSQKQFNIYSSSQNGIVPIDTVLSYQDSLMLHGEFKVRVSTYDYIVLIINVLVQKHKKSNPMGIHDLNSIRRYV